MAVSAGILLRKSQLLSAAVMAQRKSNALMKLVKLEANTAATMEEAIDGIVQIAYSVLDADRISVFFVDQSRGELFSIVSRDASQLSFPIGKGISGHVAKTGKALNIADAYQNSKFDPSFDIHTGYRTRSILCMPIKHAADGTIIGVISAINKRGSSGISAGVQKQMVTAATAHRLTRNQTLNISRTQSVSVSRATSFGVGQVQPPSPNLAPQKGVSFAPANHKYDLI
jgi:signal transduction protein with GAF and PtsI domain